MAGVKHVLHTEGDERPMPLKGFDSSYQIAGCIRFEHETAGTGGESFFDHLFRVHDAEYQDLLFRVLLAVLTRGNQTIQF